MVCEKKACCFTKLDISISVICVKVTAGHGQRDNGQIDTAESILERGQRCDNYRLRGHILCTKDYLRSKSYLPVALTRKVS